MNARSEAECYTRYRATARRFELFGAAILAAGVLCYTAFGDSVKWPGVALGAVGLCAFALGAASLRPHNVVKSFALQCMQNPNEEYARGLLNALTAERRIRLTMRSIRMVEGAVSIQAIGCAGTLLGVNINDIEVIRPALRLGKRFLVNVHLTCQRKSHNMGARLSPLFRKCRSLLLARKKR